MTGRVQRGVITIGAEIELFHLERDASKRKREPSGRRRWLLDGGLRLQQGVEREVEQDGGPDR